MCAVKAGNKQLVELLVEKGASVHITDVKDRSALFYAVILGENEIGQVLLGSGASICDNVRLAVLQSHFEQDN